MIDYAKIWVSGKPKEFFLSNPLLEFQGTFNPATGVASDFPLKGKYKNLDIEIKSQNHTEIRGSLHKQFTGGYNWNDFYFYNLKSTILTLCDDLNLALSECQVKNLEFGVNVILPFNPNEFIKRLIVFKKGMDFSSFGGSIKDFGVKCRLNQYTLKIYNKKEQMKLSENILRFEIKVKAMSFLPPIKSLCDLLKYENLLFLRNKLIENFKLIVLADFGIKSETLNLYNKKIYENGLKSIYWQDLHEKSHKIYSYQLKRFREIQILYGKEKYHNLVKTLIVNKSAELLHVVSFSANLKNPQFGHFEPSIGIANHLNTSFDNALMRCKSCGRDISFQKKGSIFCSEKYFDKEGKRCRNKDSNLKRKIKCIKAKEFMYWVY